MPVCRRAWGMGMNDDGVLLALIAILLVTGLLLGVYLIWWA
jgi:hypothetical protein